MRSNLKLVVNNEFFFFEALEKEKEKFNKHLKLVKITPESTETPVNETGYMIRKKAI